MLKILTAPNNILNKTAKPVKKIDKKIKKLVEEMISCLKKQKDPQGVGLSAPQIGYNLQLFIIIPDEKEKPQVFINPKIISTKTSQKSSLFAKSDLASRDNKVKSQKLKVKNPKHKLEGCLSIPKIWAPIKRNYEMFIEYTDLKENLIKKKFTGFESIIIEHEIDHLNGIVFTQRALEQDVQLYEETGDKLEKITA